MSTYQVPAKPVRQEMRVANSRFIASLAPVFTVEQARAFISQIRAEFKDASHNVPAYLVGYGDSVTAHCSDDGEPGGTAGRPALAVLQGSGLGDVAVVVTRYFGGTKLGTGGLVRAYSDAVRLVVEAASRARRVATTTVMIAIPYNWLERLRRLVEAQGGRIVQEEFAGDVTVVARFPSEQLPGFDEKLRQVSNDRIKTIVVSQEEELAPVL